MLEENNNKTFGDRFFSEKTALITALVSIAVLLGSLIVFLCCKSWQFSTKLDEQIVANYGDFVGGTVGTLLAFTAAILYYVALREQRKDVETNKKSLSIQNKALEQQIDEFKQQRVELENTRKVYEQQTQLMKEQSRIMRQQQFESSFYSMIRVYVDCKIQLNNKGTDCFRTWVDSIEAHLPTDFGNFNIYERHNQIVESFENFYLSQRDVLSPYFKTIYRILNLIDNTKYLVENEKMQYVKFFRAQLSDNETKLLYYNYHSAFSGSARGLSYKLNFLKHYDYLTSIDADKIHDPKLIQNKELTHFMHLFDGFLKKEINALCDGLSEIEQSAQMSYDYKDIISEIISTPDITIKLSIPLKEEKFSNNFCSLLSDFICDRLFLSQFGKKKEILNFAEYGEVDNRRVYTCTLHSSFIQKLKTDNDYE